MHGFIALFLVIGFLLKTKSTFNRYLILVICVIGFANPVWANIFLPTCDTIVLVNGKVLIAETINHSQMGIMFDFCDEDKRIIIRPDKIQASWTYTHATKKDTFESSTSKCYACS